MSDFQHYRSAEAIPEPKPYCLSPKMHFVFLGFVVVGFVTFLVGLRQEPERIWHSFLLNYFYWLCLGLSGVFFTALNHLVSASWASPLKRIPESFAAYLPAAFLLTFVLFAGLHHLYEWTHHDAVMQDAILKGKQAYLNVGFFVFRNIAAYLVWIAGGLLFLRNSLKQDMTGEVNLSRKSKKTAAPFILLFAVTFTLFSFDWLMSLEPHWFSTIFGVYCFAGLFESGMAMVILFTYALWRQGALRGVVNENHFHDLGKLMFAFCVFWAYIAFSQYMLIWYGNLPEETGYLIRRTEGEWMPVAIALLFGKFIIPFFLLISRWAKRRIGFLLFASLWVLAAQWLDVYWMVYPMMGKPVIGWQEAGLFLGFLGIFALSVTWVLQRIPPVGLRDPRLLEGVNYHQ